MPCIPAINSIIVRPEANHTTSTHTTAVAGTVSTSQAVEPSERCSALSTTLTAPLPGCTSSSVTKLRVLSPMT